MAHIYLPVPPQNSGKIVLRKEPLQTLVNLIIVNILQEKTADVKGGGIPREHVGKRYCYL